MEIKSEQIELFPGNEISQESQQRLETEIQIELSKLGAFLYTLVDNSSGYFKLIAIQKKLNEYFDNTRLLQTQIKGVTQL